MSIHDIARWIILSITMLSYLTITPLSSSPQLSTPNGSGSKTAFQSNPYINEFFTVSWNADGKHIAVAGTSGIHIYDVIAHTFTSFGNLSSAYYPAVWSPDGQQLAAESYDSSNQSARIFVWDKNAVLITTFQQTNLPRFDFFSMAWSPNGQILAIGTGNGTMLLSPKRPTSSKF